MNEIETLHSKLSMYNFKPDSTKTFVFIQWLATITFIKELHVIKSGIRTINAFRVYQCELYSSGENG